MYQATFSTRQLSTSSAAFPAFSVDSDGLVSMSKTNVSQSVKMSDFPIFPLKHLMDFFNNVNNSNLVKSGKNTGGIRENLSLLVLLVFLFPGLIFRKNGDNPQGGDFDGIKAYLGKLRLTGINRTKKLLYNDRSNLRSRKDA